SNEDFTATGRATPAERNEKIRIYQEALASGFPAGDGSVYVVAPDGKVAAAMTVPRACDAPNVIPLLERFRGRKGQPVVAPGPLSRPPVHGAEDLVLHLVARYVDSNGAIEKQRTTYHEYPGENWLLLGRAE